MRIYFPMRSWCTMILTCGAAVCSAGTARAAVVESYVTDGGSYSGAVGSSIPVSIYLKETLTGASASIITAEGGLTGVGAAIDVLSTNGGSAAQVNNVSYLASPAFGGALSVSYNQGTGAAANNLEFNEDIAPAQAHVGRGTGTIFLGTVNVTVGSGTTTYRLTSLFNDTINNSFSDLGQANGYTIAANPAPFGTDLDVTQAGVFTGADDVPDYTFKVSPTPEPASLLVVLPPLALGLARRRVRGTVPSKG